jgi:hypothetical protein
MTRPEAEALLTSEITKSGLTRKLWYRTIYLKSEHWHELRSRALETHGRKCHNCSATRKLDVHHIRYSSIYDVEVTDLQILCRTCHDKAHAPPEPKPKKVRDKKSPLLYRVVGKATKRYFGGSLEDQLAQIRGLLKNSEGFTTGDMASLTRKKRKVLKKLRKLNGPLPKKKKNR